MASLKEQAERLRGVSPKNAFSQALFELENEIIGYNVAQLEQGRNRLGNLIGRYSDWTIGYAKNDRIRDPSRKQGGNAYDFDWTGSFLEKMRVNVVGDTAELTSDVSYISSIERLGTRNRANNKLFGLTPKHLAEFKDRHLLPKMLLILKSRNVL